MGLDLTRFEYSLWLTLHLLRTVSAQKGAKAGEYDLLADFVAAGLISLSSGALPIFEFDAAPTLDSCQDGMKNFKQRQLPVVGTMCLLVSPATVIDEATGNIIGTRRIWTLVSADPAHPEDQGRPIGALEFHELSMSEQRGAVGLSHALIVGAGVSGFDGSKPNIIGLTLPDFGDPSTIADDIDQHVASLAFYRALGLLMVLCNGEALATVMSTMLSDGELAVVREKHETPQQPHLRVYLAESQRRKTRLAG